MIKWSKSFKIDSVGVHNLFSSKNRELVKKTIFLGPYGVRIHKRSSNIYKKFLQPYSFSKMVVGASAWYREICLNSANFFILPLDDSISYKVQRFKMTDSCNAWGGFAAIADSKIAIASFNRPLYIWHTAILFNI